MAQYVVLIYEDETSWIEGDPAEIEQGMQAHGEFAQVERGRSCAAARRCSRPPRRPRSARTAPAASPSPTGRSSRPRRRSAASTSIEAADLDEAIALAKQVPAPFGGVELRPVQIWS